MNPDCPTRQPVGACEVERPAPAPDLEWLMQAPLHQIIGSHTACAALQSELRARDGELANLRAVVRRVLSRRERLAKVQRLDIWENFRASGFDQLAELLGFNERGASPTTRETAR